MHCKISNWHFYKGIREPQRSNSQCAQARTRSKLLHCGASSERMCLMPETACCCRIFVYSPLSHASITLRAPRREKLGERVASTRACSLSTRRQSQSVCNVSVALRRRRVLPTLLMRFNAIVFSRRSASVPEKIRGTHGFQGSTKLHQDNMSGIFILVQKSQ